MRVSFVLVLPLLAGCSSAAAEPASAPTLERRPMITRIVSIDTTGTITGDGGGIVGMKIQMIDAPCQTNDRMPTGNLDFGALAPMPSARPARALPYIPNVCPVIAAPGQKPARPAVLQRERKGVREPAAQP